MRILYVTDQIYIHGGAEKILIQKLNYWADNYGYDVMLITSRQKGNAPFFPLSDKVKWNDLEVGYQDGLSYFDPKNFGKLYSHTKKLKKAIADFNPDATFLLGLGIERYVLPFIAGKSATFNEYHTSYYGFYLGYLRLSTAGKIKNKILQGLIRFCESFYTNIVFLNQEEFDHYDRRNGIIIPNFFDPVETVAREKKKQILSLGRLSYQKGYDLLIDVWEIVTKKMPDWTLEIYGNGENHDELHKQINEKGLSDTLKLNAAINNVNEKLAESAFYVMSSRFETFPMVLLEAMSNQLPIVSFDCPTGPRSMVIEGEDGILAKPNNLADLADKMIYMMSNDDIRAKMGKAAAANITRFSSESVMDQWDQLLKNKVRK